VEGTVVTTSHFVETSGDRVAFFLDRIDVSDPDRPEIAPAVNVPGSVAGFDSRTGRIVTVDYQVSHFRTDNASSCLNGAVEADYDHVDGICYVTQRSLNFLELSGGGAVLLGSLQFDGKYMRDVRVTGSRVFVGLTDSRYGWWGGSSEDPRPELLVVPLDRDAFEVTSSIRMSSPYTWLTDAVGNKAVVVSDTPPALSIYDASDPGRLVMEKEVLLTGYAYDMHVLDDVILSANAQWGVQSIDL